MILSTIFRSSQKFSEEDIIDALIREGSGASDVIEYLYERVHPIVAFQVMKESRPTENSMDLVQDGLLQLIEKLRDGKFDGRSSVITYLVSICRLQWFQQLRRWAMIKEKINEISLEEHSQPRDLSRFLSEKENQAGIRQVFECLPEKCGEILRRFYWDQFDMDSIADRLGYKSAKVAKVRKSYCQKALMNFLRENPDLLDLFYRYD